MTKPNAQFDRNKPDNIVKKRPPMEGLTMMNGQVVIKYQKRK